MLQCSANTLRLLDALERQIDAQVELDYQKQWEDFLFDRFDGDIFIPNRKKKIEKPDFPAININDAVENQEWMLLSELGGAASALAGNGVPCVRANYGTAILSSLFGAEMFMMPYETNTLPTSRPLGGTDQIRALLDKGMPDLNAGLGAKVFAMGECFAEVFEHYPNIKQFVTVYHPDTQGPLDICELLWGCEMFYAMYDEPELVHALLQLVTDTYKAFMDQWLSLFPPKGEFRAHWSNIMHRGVIMLRNDSAMNISPEQYAEFARPYDAQLLDHYGGGAIHFCGRGDHYISRMCDIPGLFGVNITQPHLNDMETIYRFTVDRGIKLLGMKTEYTQLIRQGLARPGGFSGNLNMNG